MKNKTIVLYCIIAILLAGNVFQFCWNNYSNRLFTDAVPDEETALKIGEAVAYSAYDDGLWSNRPFKVIFIESKQVWVVYGTLPEDYEGMGPVLGGTPEITIRKSDGKILKIEQGE